MTLKTFKVKARTSGVSRVMKRFRKEEDGGMIIFSLFLFVLILWSGGMAVDLMRFETTRAKLQGTLDRASLAAADLDQTEMPDVVVADYFAKAGMSQFLNSTDYEIGLNYKTVTINATAEMPLFFYDIPRVFVAPFTAGLTAIDVSGVSTAEERVTDVEVSLVLDVSSSMNSSSRIQNLRPAARDFVTTVMANNTNAPQGLITVSMIPYSAVVNPGSTIEPHMNINRTHMYSTCPIFDSSAFNTLELDLNASYDHISHFDPSWYSNARNYNPINYPWCHMGDRNSIVVHSTDEEDLHDAIDDLVPYGNTAIDMGMKWGAALLDPSTNAIVASLANDPDSGVPSIAGTRPEAHGTPDVLKVIVLMTDGANTTQYDLAEPFKSGMSPVWFDKSNDSQELYDVSSNRVSVQYSGEDTVSRWDDWFYWSGYSSSSRYQRYPNGFANRTAYINAAPVGAAPDPGVGLRYVDHVHNATWQELYADRVYNRVNNTYFVKPYNHGAISWSEYLEPDYAVVSIGNSTQGNTNLKNICDEAKAQGIIIYTIAFEAPSGGQTVLSDCASSPSHYFDVDGTDISIAFASIASDIRALKLVQ